MYSGKIVIAPRASGKTTKILSMFDPKKNDVLIVPNKNNLKRLVDFYSFNNIISNYQGIDRFKSLNINTLYIDEYLFLPDDFKLSIRQFIDTSKINKIIVMTTSDKLYDKDVIDFIRVMNGNNLQHLFKDFLSNGFIQKYKDYFYNLLTDPNLSIESYYDSMKSSIGKEAFEREYLGIWHK